jgi:DNA polymerase zeta
MLGLCAECYIGPQETVAKLSSHIRNNELRLINAHRVCTTCTGTGPDQPIECESLDCPWLYFRKRAENKSIALETIEELLWDVDLDSEEEYTAETTDGESTEFDVEDVLYRTPRRERSFTP